MALSAERKQMLARMTLPSDTETVKRATLFRQRSGLTSDEFSRAIGYAGSTLSVYLNGNYGSELAEEHDGSGNTRAIRAALVEYMDLWEGMQQPQRLAAPHRTKDFLRVVDACSQALKHSTAYVVDGPPGTQKTFSLRAAEHEINARNDGTRALYIYARINHSPLNFLREICNTAGVVSNGYIDNLMRKLRFFLVEHRMLLIVDEAQHLGHETLEVLRQLLDLPPYFAVLLAGSHDLTQRLSHWQMEQWRSRVRKTLYLNGPSEAECRQILRAELGPELTDDDCDQTIAQCQATGSRVEVARGKAVSKSFDYTSARDLFGAIERAREVSNAQSQAQKAGAA